MIAGSWHYKHLNDTEQKIGKLISVINDLIVNYSDYKGSEADANLIMNQIWLGNLNTAQDFNFVTSKQIKAIINATTDVPNKFDFIDYTNYYIKDEDACKENLMYVMECGANIINSSVIDQKPILVHCKRGHHRSASIIAFYLMKYHNMSLIYAIYLIKTARPTTFRRITCMLQELILYEINRTN